MNEIQPSNIQYLLWSDDDIYMNEALLNDDQFMDAIDQIKLDHDLLPYGNVAYDDGRHNMLMEMLGNTLSQHVRGRHLYETWFIDDNNDLWCRDDTFQEGTNYYLYREFNTDNEAVKIAIKSSLLLNSEAFDSDMILDNTSSIGDRLIEILELNKSEEVEEDYDQSQNAEAMVNAYDIIYLQMLTDEYFDGVFSRYTFDLDKVAETMQKHTNEWNEWDRNNEHFTAQMGTIDSMKMYLGIVEREMKNDLLEACQDKEQFSYDILNKKMFGKEL